MEARVARLEAIIPTLATKEDLVKLELKIEKTIRTEITTVQNRKKRRNLSHESDDCNGDDLNRSIDFCFHVCGKMT